MESKTYAVLLLSIGRSLQNLVYSFQLNIEKSCLTYVLSWYFIYKFLSRFMITITSSPYVMVRTVQLSLGIFKTSCSICVKKNKKKPSCGLIGLHGTCTVQYPAAKFTNTSSRTFHEPVLW